MIPRHRRTAGLLSLLVLVGLLAGCVTLPRQGAVIPANASAVPVNPGVQIVPLPPRQDASPTEIVEGFIQAMTSAEGDYEVARDYLTPEASALWQPTSGVAIYADAAPVLVEDRVLLRSSLQGRLDEWGTYRQENGSLNQDFGLVRDPADQWRISTPPGGLLLSSTLFGASFVRVNLYFWAVDEAWLVPDPRYVPRGLPGYERAARLQVAGPNDWLAPAVRPVDPALELGGLVISRGGLATVTLSEEQPLTVAERVAVATQLVWLLRQFEVVQQVAITGADGIRWILPGLSSEISIEAFPDADPVDRRASQQLFAATDGALTRILEGGRGIEQYQVATALTGVTQVAVRADGQEAAALNAEEDLLSVAQLAGETRLETRESEALRRPDYSRQGELWLPAGERIWVRSGDHTDDDHGADAHWHEVAVEGSPGSIQALRLSPDGARVALVISDATGAGVLGIARIIRSEDGIHVQQWRPLRTLVGTAGQASVLDVGWADDSSLLLLEADGGSTFVVEMGQEGASAVSKGPVGAGDLAEVAVAPGVAPVVRTSVGALYRYTANGRWQLVVENADGVAYPG